MTFKLYLLSIFVLFLALNCAQASLQPVCSDCKHGYQCASGKCWGTPGKCVTDGDYKELITCGFKDECVPCKSSLECATEKCWGPGNGTPLKCTYDSEASKDKCFSAPSPSPVHTASPLKLECDICKASSECITKKCWGPGSGAPLKCTYDTQPSKDKCFPPSTPSIPSAPSTPSTPAPQPSLKSECEFCSKSSECVTRKCWGPGNGAPLKCTYDTQSSRDKCFLPSTPSTPVPQVPTKQECEICTSSTECVTQKCWGPGGGHPLKCTYDARKDKCFETPKKPSCSLCQSNSECATGKCWGYPPRCVSIYAGYDELLKCGYKKLCDSCSIGNECATKFCSGNFCKHSNNDNSCISQYTPEPGSLHSHGGRSHSKSSNGFHKNKSPNKHHSHENSKNYGYRRHSSPGRRGGHSSRGHHGKHNRGDKHRGGRKSRGGRKHRGGRRGHHSH